MRADLRSVSFGLRVYSGVCLSTQLQAMSEENVVFFMSWRKDKPSSFFKLELELSEAAMPLRLWWDETVLLWVGELALLSRLALNSAFLLILMSAPLQVSRRPQLDLRFLCL